LTSSRTKESRIFTIGKGIENNFRLSFIDCNSTAFDIMNLKMLWYLNKISIKYDGNGNQIEYEEILNKYCLNSIAVDHFTFGPNELTGGDYRLRVYAFDSNYPNEFVEFNMKIQVGASPLIINLNKLNIELNWNEILQLDFIQNSYDPDSMTNNDDLQFDLICIHSSNKTEQLELLNSVNKIAKQGNFNFKLLNLIFESANLRIFEKNCFDSNIQNLPSQIKLDPTTKLLTINSSVILLNSTDNLPIILQIYLHKDTRLTISSEIKLSLNISSSMIITPSLNLDELASQLDLVDNLAEKNPKQALSLLGTFADAINNRADSSQNFTTTTKSTQNDENSQLSNVDVLIYD
jgi:hypothetical protein